MSRDDTTGNYVIWLDDEGRECVQLAPMVDEHGAHAEGRGWGRYFTDDVRDPTVLVRIGHASVTAESSEPLIVAEITVTGRPRVDAQLLRSVPLGRIEAAVNRPNHHAALSPRLLGTWTGHVEPPPTRPSLWASERPTLDLSEPETLTVTVPTGRQRRPDSFYRDVAIIYSHIAGQDHNPAHRMAEINDVPVTTVHGWVKEARARGLLAPARRGTAS